MIPRSEMRMGEAAAWLRFGAGGCAEPAEDLPPQRFLNRGDFPAPEAGALPGFHCGVQPYFAPAFSARFRSRHSQYQAIHTVISYRICSGMAIMICVSTSGVVSTAPSTRLITII